MLTFLISLIACGPTQPEPLLLTHEHYDWICHDYSDYSEIIVSTHSCETQETGLHFIVAEYELFDGFSQKTNLTKEEPSSCEWEAEFIMIDPVCIEIIDVSIIAYVDPATWTGMLNE